MYIETEGIVVKSNRYGEADAILTVVTKKLGKIKVFSKSSKRLKSPLMSGTQIFALSEFFLYPSRDAFSLQRVELVDNFYEIASDLDKFAYSSYFIEMADQMLQENQPNSEYFFLLKQSLDLVRIVDNYELLQVVYDLKALQFVGLKPEVSKCSNCGMIEIDKYRYFSLDEGGVICKSCRAKLPSSLKIDPSSVRLMNYIYERDVRSCMQAKVSGILIKEIKDILKQYQLCHLGRMNLKSVELINNFKEVKHDNTGKSRSGSREDGRNL